MKRGLLTPSAVRIAEVYDDGEDARHFVLEPVGQGARAEATPGQFFALTVPGAGEAAFTYASLPDKAGRFAALARRVGSLTGALFEKRTGDILGVRGPLGSGWPLEELRGRRVLVLAGGCGLAPMAALIGRLAEGNLAGSAAVIYGARSPRAQVLSRERAAWREKIEFYETFDKPAEGVTHLGTPLAHVGDVLGALGGEPEVVLTCGPEVMMDAVGAGMVERGLSPERIWLSLERRMHCGVGLCGHCYVAHTYVCREGPTYRWDRLLALRARSPAREPLHTEIRHC